MSIAGFRSQNHPQQTRKRGAADAVDDRETAPEVFDPLNERFGFTLDVAAAPHNAKCERFYTREDDGLAQPWTGRVWCNPPYSDCRAWVEKAWEERRAGNAELVVMLLPANRVEQAWWQDLVEPYRDRPRWTTHLRNQITAAVDHYGAWPHDVAAQIERTVRVHQGCRYCDSVHVEFLRGRMRFIRPEAVIGPKGDRPPFGCCLLIWGGAA